MAAKRKRTSEAADAAADRRAGVREGSRRDTAMDRNAGVGPQRTSRPKRVRDTPLGGGGGTKGPSAVDRRAATVAGVTKAKPMLESQRHMVLGKSKTSGNPVGNATRRKT